MGIVLARLEILNLLAATGAYKLPTGEFSELGYWFLALAVITALGALGAVAESLALFGVLTPLSVGSALLAVHYLTGGHGWEVAGGWVLIAAAIMATYTAGALMLESAWGRVVLPLGKLKREANIPGRTVTMPIQFEHAEPGVRQGQ